MRPAERILFKSFSWASLAGLPGRAGLNAGFGLSYNSLVWTKDGQNVYFDTNADNVSPGFRFGFPTIEPTYYDQKTQRFAFLMVTPSGGRVEFRQIGASKIYETADSGYVQLTTKGASSPTDPVEDISITIRGTDGTQMSYEWNSGAYRCTQVKDRNGNYITIGNDDQGLLAPLPRLRVITVNYDNQLYPVSVTQTWKTDNGSGSTRSHAGDFQLCQPDDHDEPGVTVVGPPNGTVLGAAKGYIPDNSFTQLTTRLRVWKVRNVVADSPSTF
jgi:hypothetical protein